MNPWTDFDQHAMQRALEMASLGLYTTDPNPRVGCVLAHGQHIVGEGWHERAGEPHAEVNALRAAGERARGATAYVTLEPCSHFGRTPPCTAALIEAQVARVIYSMEDPNPKVSGGGAQILRAAGIEVAKGLLADESEALNRGFCKRMRHGLPWVRLKLGTSLDGRTALANGASRWITAEPARKDAQRFRARSSVVLTGIGTLLADDPALNVRVPGATRQPLRVVLDSHLRAPPQARVFTREGPALVFAARDDAARRTALEQCGARVEILPANEQGTVALPAVLQRLAALEANEVMVEAGARLAGALLAAELVDELLAYIAPCLLGSEARPLALLPSIDNLTQRWPMRFVDVTRIGDDLRIVAHLQPRAQ